MCMDQLFTHNMMIMILLHCVEDDEEHEVFFYINTICVDVFL
jgi:hypothetical protein